MTGDLLCRRIMRMARGGSNFQRQMAAQRREAERQARERVRLAKEQEKLRTLHEIFSATPPEVVEAVVFNGRVSTIDRATGKPARPHLLSVSAERSIFQDLVLAAVDPAACLVRLNALVSPNPFDMEAVDRILPPDPEI